MKLTLIEKTSHSAIFRTTDGKYEVHGLDLNCTGRRARAAGASPCWMWRLASGTDDDFSRPAPTKARCEEDLERHIASERNDNRYGPQSQAERDGDA